MKKLILTIVFFVIGIFKPMKRDNNEVVEVKPKKVKKYKNSH